MSGLRTNPSRKQTDRPAILVTGAYSQIGQFLLPELVQDYQVITVSRKSRKPLQHETRILTMDLLKAEKKDIISVPELFAIIHLAPVFILPGVLNLFSDNLPQRVIAFSSTSISGKKHSGDAYEQRLISKLQQAENQVVEYCKAHDIHWTLFRPTLIYGADQDQNISFIRTIIKKYHFFPIVGQGKGLRQPVHAHDLAIACVQVLGNSNSFNKNYDLSGGEVLSYSDMVKRIFESLGKKPVIIKIPLPLFRLLIKGLKILPKYRFLSMEMANRMNSNLNFDHSRASDDFNYQPMSFTPNSRTLDFKAMDFKLPVQPGQ